MNSNIHIMLSDKQVSHSTYICLKLWNYKTDN